MPYSANFGIITLRKGILFDIEHIDKIDFRDYYGEYSLALMALWKNTSEDEFAHQIGDPNMSSPPGADRQFFWIIDRKVWERRFEGIMPREQSRAGWVQFETDMQAGARRTVRGWLRRIVHM